MTQTSSLTLLAKDLNRLAPRMDQVFDGQVEIDLDPNDLTHITAVLEPNDGPYRGGRFSFSIHYQNAYPAVPRVEALTKMFHPNIEYHGDICFSLFDMDPTEDVASMNSLRIDNVCNGLLYLLNNPALDDPLNCHVTDSLEYEYDSSLEDLRKLVKKTLRGEEVGGEYFEENLVDADMLSDDEFEAPDPVNSIASPPAPAEPMEIDDGGVDTTSNALLVQGGFRSLVQFFESLSNTGSTSTASGAPCPPPPPPPPLPTSVATPSGAPCPPPPPPPPLPASVALPSAVTTSIAPTASPSVADPAPAPVPAAAEVDTPTVMDTPTVTTASTGLSLERTTSKEGTRPAENRVASLIARFEGMFT